MRFNSGTGNRQVDFVNTKIRFIGKETILPHQKISKYPIFMRKASHKKMGGFLCCRRYIK